MPKPLLIVIFILYSFFSFSQDYVPFPEDSARWCFTYHDLQEGGGMWASSTTGYFYSINNDTIIHGKVYKNLGLTQIWSYWNGTYGSGASNSNIYYGLAGCFREEDKKIYFYKYLAPEYSPLWQFGNLSIVDTTEILQYDFDVEIGDTIIQHQDWTGDSLRIVTMVDSISMNDGTFRRRIFSDQGGFSERWIEGIGSDEGFMMPYCFEFEWYDYTLNCFWNKNQYLFGDDSCDYVEFEIGIQNADPINSISVVPNPFKTEFIITNLPTAFAYHISVYNYAGEECIAQEVNGPTQSINADALPSGIYILVIQTENTTYSKKVIKL